MPAEFRDCCCCGRSGLGPFFAITAPGRPRPHYLCLSCGPHVRLDGRTASLELPGRCPCAVPAPVARGERPALRIVANDGAG